MRRRRVRLLVEVVESSLHGGDPGLRGLVLGLQLVSRALQRCRLRRQLRVRLHGEARLQRTVLAWRIWCTASEQVCVRGWS